MSNKKISYHNLTFDEFRLMAKNPNLSMHQKVGFPDEYRDGFEEHIFADLLSKTRALKEKKQNIIEVGPGCSLLPRLLIDLCGRNESQLTLVDSEEMLANIPDKDWVNKIAGKYPEMSKFFIKNQFSVDLIIFYSVFQYIFAEGNMWDSLDKSLSLLREGGEILLGDIPNVTMRKRFFSSGTGIKTHQEFTKTNNMPEVTFNKIELGQMDDSIILAILMRCRAQGFHAWVLPQAQGLPMSNRREDILIRRP